MKAMLSTVASPLARPLTRDRISVYNSVAVRDTPLFAGDDHYPQHKRALCNAVSDVVSPGDSVVIVGGGRGVAAVWAARQTQDVTVYEAAGRMVAVLEETARLNNADYDVVHAVVGQARDVYGSLDGAPQMAPGALSGDVLVLDCEGAELDILPSDGFDHFVVETHPRHGAPTSRVLERLDDARVLAPDPIDGDVVVA